MTLLIGVPLFGCLTFRYLMFRYRVQMSEALKNKSGCPAPDSDIMLVMNSGQTVMSGDGNCINRNLNDDLR